MKREDNFLITSSDQSVVGNRYVARAPSVMCEARANSALGEGFKIDSNTDMKENYP